ncbi:MAG: PHP domain-containing protein [Candidatus Acidiferrales bacterium]
MKCDLHVHSYHSGLCTVPVVSRFCRESYSAPEAVFATLRRRGMNLFTLTDHDSIEGAEALRRHRDFFVSEEVSCRMPSGTLAHIGVYDITERQHIQLQQRRHDLIRLLMYLSERQLFFSINHVFSSLTGPRLQDDFPWFKEYFPAIETRNGHMLAEQNANSVRLAYRWNKIGTGGSDAHVLASVGSAYTEVTGARDKEEFFTGLRMGRGQVRGESGSFQKLTRDVFLIAFEVMREKAWTALLAPLAPLIPAVTLLNYCNESAFGRLWARRILGGPESRRRADWFDSPEPAVEEWT